MKKISKYATLTDKERIEKGLNNPTNEVFYFKHLEKPIGYILMSKRVSVDMFIDELFNKTEQITEEQLDQLLVDYPQFQVVFVGDDVILDKYFSDEKEAD